MDAIKEGVATRVQSDLEKAFDGFEAGTEGKQGEYEVQVISLTETLVRYKPASVGAPRYFKVKVSEML